MNIDFDAQVWADMEKAISCGYCGGITVVDSGHDCSRCGRVLCEKCGRRWGWCADHIPLCSHPELVPTQWNQPRPASCKMAGSCQHNMTCPVCGYGWGCMPDPCNADIPCSLTLEEMELVVDNLLNREEEPEDAILVASGILQRSVDQALQESPSPDWEQELKDLEI